MKLKVGIDINGLNPEDRKRIATIGFDPWLNEVVVAKSRIPSKSEMPSYKRCTLRSKCFYATKRQAAYVTEGNGDYCSPLCRASVRAAKSRARAAQRRSANS